jgi:isopenicillin-N epimerase
MAHMPLPRGSHERLQARLWYEHQIEVPIVSWNDRWFIRVSCHLYNDPSHIDRLIGALRQELSSGSG